MTELLEKVKDIVVKCTDMECGNENVVTAIADYDMKKIEQYVKCKICGANVKILSIGKAYEVEA